MNFKKPVNIPFSNLKLPLNTDITDAFSEAHFKLSYDCRKLYVINSR